MLILRDKAQANKERKCFSLKKVKVGRNPSAGNIYNENKQKAGKHVLASPCL